MSVGVGVGPQVEFVLHEPLSDDYFKIAAFKVCFKLELVFWECNLHDMWAEYNILWLFADDGCCPLSPAGIPGGLPALLNLGSGFSLDLGRNAERFVVEIDEFQLFAIIKAFLILHFIM